MKKIFQLSVLTMLIMTIIGLSSVSAREFVISGSSTIQPFMERLSPLWQKKTGNLLEIRGGGSGAGIRNTLAKESDMGMVSRALGDSEKAKLEYVTIGMDTLVIIVNIRNPIKEVNRKTVADLFSGKTVNWSELTSWDEPVILISKEIGRSTLDLFEDYSGLRHPNRKSGSGTLISSDAVEIGANIESLTLVGGLPGAVGYVSLGTANELIGDGLPIRILDLDGTSPEVRNILSGTYPIQRELNLVFLQKTPIVSSLIEEALSSSGQRIVKELGFIPVK
ncbi:MAG: substrate-binding domain-containing protein [Desulfamplus sp.]|nr:substrate-binding domain-containing protein [Desulfamplus sp.]